MKKLKKRIVSRLFIHGINVLVCVDVCYLLIFLFYFLPPLDIDRFILYRDLLMDLINSSDVDIRFWPKSMCFLLSVFFFFFFLTFLKHLFGNKESVLWWD